MQLGSVWGHGAYQAPDWTADWLHRELGAWLDAAAQAGQPRRTARAGRRLRESFPQGRVPWQPRQRGRGADGQRARARAIAQTAAYYDQLFSDAPALHTSREHFAMKENTLPDAGRREQLTRFFFWTAWAAAAPSARAPRSPTPTIGRTSR